MKTAGQGKSGQVFFGRGSEYTVRVDEHTRTRGTHTSCGLKDPRHSDVEGLAGFTLLIVTRTCSAETAEYFFDLFNYNVF
jgi:hypothetical protein